MSLYKYTIERLDEFTTRQGIVSGEWCKLLDMLEEERKALEAKNVELEKQVKQLEKIINSNEGDYDFMMYNFEKYKQALAAINGEGV